eukprot:scaffold335611_cov45-Prasinocladus_malaysianus.AAC.2
MTDHTPGVTLKSNQTPKPVSVVTETDDGSSKPGAIVNGPGHDSDDTSPTTPRMFSQHTQEAEDKENQGPQNCGTPRESKIPAVTTHVAGLPPTPFTLIRQAPATARRLAGSNGISDAASVSGLQHMLDEKVE